LGGTHIHALKPFAGEVQPEVRKIATNTIEYAPKIGGFAVGVVENDG